MKINKLALGLLAIPVAFACTGCGKEEKFETDISAELAQKSAAFIQTYDNKFTENPDVPATDEEYYVKVASSFSDTENLTIGSTTFAKNETFKMSIGNNSFIVKSAFKVSDNDLLVALPILNAEGGMDGKVKITYGNKSASITAFNSLNKLSIGQVSAGGSPADGHTVNLVAATDSQPARIEETRQDGRNYIKFTLLNGSTPVSGVAFTRKVYSTDVKTGYGLNSISNGAFSIYNYWKNGPLTEAKSREIDYSITIPSVGVAHVILDITEVVPSAS